MSREERTAAFAGRLYPGDPGALRARLDRLLAAGAEEPSTRWLLVPHGGLDACGLLLGAALARLPRDTERVLLVGPVHDPGPEGAVLLDDRSRWRTALGALPLEDPTALARAVEAAGGAARVDRVAHDREHSLELPATALLHRAPGCRVLPVLLPVLLPPGVVAAVVGAGEGEGGAHAILATTDLDHYHGASAGLRRHRRVAELLEAGDPRALEAALASGEVAPCGGAAASVFLEAARREERAVRVLAHGWAGPSPGRLGFLAAGAFPGSDREE